MAKDASSVDWRLLHTIDHGDRVGAIAEEAADTPDPIDMETLSVVEHRKEGGFVGAKVCKDGQTHCWLPFEGFDQLGF